MSIRNAFMALAVLILVQSLSAHGYLPATPGQTVTAIPDIGVSRAAYREITAGDQIDVYEFTAKKGQEIYIQMTIPLIDRMAGFAPAFVLVYGGAESASFAPTALTKGIVADPPHEVVDAVLPNEGSDAEEPPLLGVRYDGSEPVVFNEPFTGTRYWIRQTLTVNAPADGFYRIGVYSPDRSLGKYVLAPGRAEKFSFGDVLGLPGVRWQVRAFAGEPLWPDALFWSALGAAALAGIGYGIYALVR